MHRCKACVLEVEESGTQDVEQGVGEGKDVGKLGVEQGVGVGVGKDVGELVEEESGKLGVGLGVGVGKDEGVGEMEGEEMGTCMACGVVVVGSGSVVLGKHKLVEGERGTCMASSGVVGEICSGKDA